MWNFAATAPLSGVGGRLAFWASPSADPVSVWHARDDGGGVDPLGNLSDKRCHLRVQRVGQLELELVGDDKISARSY